MKRLLTLTCVLTLFACTAFAQPKSLRAEVLKAVQQAGFDQVIDYGPYGEACPGAWFCPTPALPIAHPPNIDVAVLELDPSGRLVQAANVLLSRDYPMGLDVPIDATLTASEIRWRRWDIERSDGGTFSSTTGERLTVKPWDAPFTPADDIITGRDAAPFQVMAPYPASLFKILVAYRILRLVDQGAYSLTTPYLYPVTGEERSIADWMEPMITVSDNYSTRAMLKLLHDRGELNPANNLLNEEFANLGLGTLQVNGTNPDTGGNWQPGQIHMTALDTAKLLWLVDGGHGAGHVLWTTPAGVDVTPSELSDSSRAFFKRLLYHQGFNEVLSTANFCKAPHVQTGIASLVPPEYIGPDGTVTVEGIAYGADVGVCQQSAQVVFGHKTGLTFNYGADAGFVHSLPGHPERHYVMAFIANLGYRYTDDWARMRWLFPCYEAVGGICYTQRIPRAARRIDDALILLGRRK